MNHARHTLFGAAALSRGLARLLLTLCLIPVAATPAHAFETGGHATPPQGVESEYEQEMRILRMLENIDRLAQEHEQAERRAKAVQDGGHSGHAAQTPSRSPQAEAGIATAESRASQLEDRMIVGAGMVIVLLFTLFLGVRFFFARRGDPDDSPTDLRGRGYAEWKRQRQARRDKLE